MVTRSITFRDDVIDPLIVEAEVRNVSVNWLVNQLCEEGLKRLLPELRLTRRVDQ